MDILKDDPLEFLDFTGVEESERKRVLSSLQSTTSNLQLPWIITQNVPSKPKSSRGGVKKPGGPVVHNYPTEIPPPVHPGTIMVTHPYDQGQFHQAGYSIAAPNMGQKYPVPPVSYQHAMVAMPPIYTSFHHPGAQGMRTTLINPLIYSTEPAYTYAQVSPVSAPYDNHHQFAHNPQYVPETPPPPPTHHEYNGVSPPMIPEGITPPIVNHIPPQPVYAIPQPAPLPTPTPVTIEPPTSAPPAQPEPPHATVNNDSSRKLKPLEKPPPIVSYGVPNSSPFPTNKEVTPGDNASPKEVNPPAEPSPVVNKTDDDQEKRNGEVQNGVTANGVDNAAARGNKSWASLFKKGMSMSAPNDGVESNNAATQEVKDKENNNVSCPIKKPKRSQFVDPTCYRMGEYLLSHSVDGKTTSLQPRGLINRSNYCYINSILQALLACPPLYNLLTGLSKNITSNEKRKPTPVIDSMCKLVNEFEHLPAGQRVGRRTEKNQKKEAGVSINCGNPFEPSWIYKMLNGMRSDSFRVEGRQEDAEEFFGCLLNGLNDEIQELMKLVANDTEESTAETVPEVEQEPEDWQVMGPKNKGSITRKTVFGKTPISSIFGGLLRSKIHRAGDESTNNIQPFFTLQLNIEKAKTVPEALEALTTKNQLEGVTSSKTNEQVEAWQQVMIEELPVVLVLHLKCFDYQLNGCTKIMKSLEFPIDLKIDPKLLSTKMNSSREKQYKLFAVVYHDGKEASKGHYLTDAFHVGYNSWLRYDDASVKAVSEEQVLSPQRCRVPYLLFYRRSDTIRSK